MATNPVDVPPVQQRWWKRLAVISFFSGAGFAVTLAVIIGAWGWYSSRPTPQKPWDNRSLTAAFDDIRVEGEQNHLVFFYTVENHTDTDYKLDDASALEVHTTAKLALSDSYSLFRKNPGIRLPVFIPARKRALFLLDTTYPYPTAEDHNAALEQRKEFREAVKKYVKSEMPNLDGFSLFDESSRYEIDFPPGWKSEKESQNKTDN
jgi:hypothetical protein